jgi:hypothetical protein
LTTPDIGVPRLLGELIGVPDGVGFWSADAMTALPWLAMVLVLAVADATAAEVVEVAVVVAAVVGVFCVACWTLAATLPDTTLEMPLLATVLIRRRV